MPASGNLPEEKILKYVFYRISACLPSFLSEASIKTNRTRFKKALGRSYTLTVTRKGKTWHGTFKRRDETFSFEGKGTPDDPTDPFQVFLNSYRILLGV